VVLCPVTRHTYLVCILLKDSILVLRVGLCPEINSWTFLRVPLKSCHNVVLVNKPTLDCFLYTLPWHPQGWLWSNKLVNRTLSCELTSNFIYTYPKISGDPQSHRMLGGNVIQHASALSYQWGHGFSSLKSFQSCLTVGENPYVFLWSNISIS
jgi:hypothetical protein